MTKGKRSPYLELHSSDRLKEVGGNRTYDPRQLYQYLFDNTDRNMLLLYNQKELAEAIQIREETMQYFFSDIKEMGWIEKIGHKSGWRLLRHPNEISWDKDTYRKLEILRKWHQKAYRDKYKKEGITKGEMLNG